MVGDSWQLPQHRLAGIPAWCVTVCHPCCTGPSSNGREAAVPFAPIGPSDPFVAVYGGGFGINGAPFYPSGTSWWDLETWM